MNNHEDPILNGLLIALGLLVMGLVTYVMLAHPR